MRIIHILKDGSRLYDITGRVVKVEDVRRVYDVIEKINASKRLHAE